MENAKKLKSINQKIKNRSKEKAEIEKELEQLRN